MRHKYLPRIKRRVLAVSGVFATARTVVRRGGRDATGRATARLLTLPAPAVATAP